jgi:hypothetical protein
VLLDTDAKLELEGRGANRLFRGANRKINKGDPSLFFSDGKTTGANLDDGGCAPRPRSFAGHVCALNPQLYAVHLDTSLLLYLLATAAQ